MSWVGSRCWESNPGPLAPVLQLSSGWWLSASPRFEGRNLYLDSKFLRGSFLKYVRKSRKNFATAYWRVLWQLSWSGTVCSFLGDSLDGGGSGNLPFGVKPRGDWAQDVVSSIGGVLCVASSPATCGGGGVRVLQGLAALFGGMTIRSRACSSGNLARFRRCRGFSPIRQKSVMQPEGHRRKLSWERTGVCRQRRSCVCQWRRCVCQWRSCVCQWRSRVYQW